MSRTQAEIERSIREELPIIFGESDAVDLSTYLNKRNAVTEYATSVTGSFLAPETVRYQSILLYVSLMLVSVSLFQIGTFKIGEGLISVNDRFLLLYTTFIAVIALIFLIKAYVDYKRGEFTREKNDHVLGDLRELMLIGLQKSRIQEYFWQEIFDEIGSAYKFYSDASARALDRVPDFEHISMKLMTLEQKDLRKVPELALEIDQHEDYFNSLKNELNYDKSQFDKKLKAALSRKRSSNSDASEDDRREKIRTAFNECLSPWFEARNKLVDEHLRRKIDETSGTLDYRRLDAMVVVLKRVRSIRKLYFTIEILAPVLFALFAIVSVRFF